MSQEKKKTSSTKTDINKFISAVSNKKYAEANKYLHSVVEDKLIKRVDNASNKPLF